MWISQCLRSFAGERKFSHHQSFPANDGRMIHSCSPAALAADVEGGGKSRRRRRPTRNCILLYFSYLFPIPTASPLSAHHFPRPTRSKSPKRWTAQGQGSHFTATGYVQLPWAIHHNRNLSGFPHKSTKIGFCLFSLQFEIGIYILVSQSENETN